MCANLLPAVGAGSGRGRPESVENAFGDRRRLRPDGQSGPSGEGQRAMRSAIQILVTAISVAAATLGAGAALAQEPKHGGILTMYHRDNPASASLHEEATYSTVVPFMPVFNNLVVYDQNKPQNSLDDIVPDLATSWTWSADNLKLIFKLRQGVKWHDGQPFTAKDVKCTWDMLMGKSEQKFRKNPRKNWYENVTEVTTNGDFEATFNLK